MTAKTAKLVTDVLAPWIVLIALCLAIAGHATGTVIGALSWGGAIALFTSILPMGFIELRRRRGRVSDIHVHHHGQRYVVLAAIIPSAGAGLVIAHVAAAPESVVTLAWVLFVGVLTMSVITWWWKISFHTGVAAMAVVVVSAVIDPLWMVAFPVVALIAWARTSRIHPDTGAPDHTWPQVIGGALWGGLVSWALVALP